MPEEGPRAKARLLALMDGARESLEGAFYEFRDLEVAQGLLRAKARGVRVRLYGESDYREDFRRYLVAASLGQREEPPRVRFAELKERVRPSPWTARRSRGSPSATTSGKASCTTSSWWWTGGPSGRGAPT